MLNMTTPNGTTGQSGNLPFNTQATAVNGEYQWMRYMAGVTYLADGYCCIEKQTSGYSAELADITWYDEFDNAGTSKGWLGTPVDARSSAIRTWYDGTTIPLVYAREYQNGLVIVVAKTGTGQAAQPTGTVTVTGAQLGIGAGRAWTRINGAQAPAVNSGAVVTSAGVTLQASRDALFLIKTAVPSAAPLVLYTDFVDVPVSGGENGLGGYLTIFGTGFGTFANLGTTAGAKVTIGGAEVANYRVLDLSVVTP